ncbi:uncharacterized protein LOC111905824 [Lactuca sativa]|uniref:uncharacterized protein LOC111905824 n=1 Tax=Lactuca sativa TaxID=4236 RepID=UPI000CD8F528|nr:uncharacterized protein LOC111905824 [Lactuca sativa]
MCDDTGPGLVQPTIPATATFELKGHILTQLKEIPFYGKYHEDAYKHMDEVNDVADYIIVPNLPHETQLLRMLPVTFKGATRDWLESLPPGSVTTWAKMKEEFVDHFCPPSKIAKLKKAIANFEQQAGKSLYEAWERGPHLTKECDLDENGNKNWKPKKEWLLYEEYKKAKEDKYKQKERGFYQKEEPVVEKRANLEEMLTRFIAASGKRHNDHDAATQETRTILRNQQASILNIEKQLGKLAHQVNERRPGELPSKTENNLRMENVNVITFSYGEVFTPLTPAQKFSTKTYRPPLPFPIRAMPDEKVKAYRTFMEHVKSLQVNIPFAETMLQTPKYLNLLKGLFAARKDMAEVVELVLDELPEKKGDPGSISIPCQFGHILATQALTDSGASINLMPFSFFKKLNLLEPKPINMKINLAYKTIIRRRGVCEDILIKVDKFVFPVDFVVLDMEEDPKIPIILGRPFLNTTCALIDVCESTLTLRVGDESAVFKTIQEVKQEETREEEISYIDLDDAIYKKNLHSYKKKI